MSFSRRRRLLGSKAFPGIYERWFVIGMLIGGFFTWGITWIALVAFYVSQYRAAKRRSAVKQLPNLRSSASQPIEDYSGTPAYQGIKSRETKARDASEQASEVAQINTDILETGEQEDPKPTSPFDPAEIARLRKDPTVQWLDSTSYRLKNDPSWLVRRTEPISKRPPRRTEPSSKRPPEVKKGPRGGRYTNARTKDGRPYRRYF